jgi:hypothetical protein
MKPTQFLYQVCQNYLAEAVLLVGTGVRYPYLSRSYIVNPGFGFGIPPVLGRVAPRLCGAQSFKGWRRVSAGRQCDYRLLFIIG